ncbi:hypothetical protein ElyMa_002750000 [Elysia marginata]|uniref:Uncharacterized protein n=1 Tax=Elysia marginata TaxID=1093978 RepID=A0AAV4HHL7_9GAST|nr:hypothetical protein ElyMa_002750000 [Elysia marginata]
MVCPRHGAPVVRPYIVHCPDVGPSGCGSCRQPLTCGPFLAFTNAFPLRRINGTGFYSLSRGETPTFRDKDSTPDLSIWKRSVYHKTTRFTETC